MNETSILTDKQLAYLEWLTTPPTGRIPSSKEQYAIDNHIAPKTLRNWEKNATFRDQWQKTVDQLVGSPDKSQALLNKLYTDAMTGDTKAASLYFQVTGRMSPQTINVARERASVDLSDKELDELIALRATDEKKLRAV